MRPRRPIIPDGFTAVLTDAPGADLPGETRVIGLACCVDSTRHWVVTKCDTLASLRGLARTRPETTYCFRVIPPLEREPPPWTWRIGVRYDLDMLLLTKRGCGVPVFNIYRDDDLAVSLPTAFGFTEADAQATCDLWNERLP